MMGPVAALALFLLCGLACLVGSVWFGVRDYKRARTWCVTEGLVIGHAKARPGPDDEGITYFKQVVEFRDADGKLVRVRSTMAYRSRSRRKVGKAVRVCYPPGQPHKARIIGENRGAYLCFGIGGVAVAIAAAVGIEGILVGAVRPTYPEPSAGSLQDFLGEAAFGLPQQHVVLVVLIAVLVLVAWGAARQRDWPSEVAFLVAVVGGLISSRNAMVVIVLSCLVGTLVMGAILSWMGVKTQLTSEQNAQVQRLLQRTSKQLDPNGPE